MWRIFIYVHRKSNMHVSKFFHHLLDNFQDLFIITLPADLQYRVTDW